MDSVRKAVVDVVTQDLNNKDHVITNSSGCPVFNSAYSMTAGATGPTLVQDIDLFDKIQHFDREQIPQRNVHALGSGAYGTFTVTNDITKYSRANLFSSVGEKTDIFVRFSGIFTEKGEAETVRDPRGFAIKFYTKEGNWDLLAINTPVFNVREAKVGPDAIHAFKRDPRSHEWNTNSLWDFVANHPESIHQTLMIFTDRDGTPASYRNMNAYGCNTFSLVNDRGERFWVKFHILSHLEHMGLDVTQAKLIAGEDPDFLSRDLRSAIQNHNYPKWTLSIQVMPEEKGYQQPFTFDCTKIWSHTDYPLIEVGTIELNRIPSDFHAEVEQAAFSPSNVVPGIGFSPDRLLQGRIFIYPDTQFHRLGPNFKQIPINCPHSQVATQYVGGTHQMEYGKAKFPAYHPSSFGGPQPLSSKKEVIQDPPLRCEHGSYFGFVGEGSDRDFFEQPRAFIETLSNRDCEHLAVNIAHSLSKASDNKVIDSALTLIRKVNEKLASAVRSEMTRMLDGSSKNVTRGQQLMKDLTHNFQNNDFQVIQE